MRSAAGRRVLGLALVALVVAVLWWNRGDGDPGSDPAPAPTVSAPSISPSGISPSGTPAADGTLAVADLPPEAQRTLRLIAAGGPFPYRQDGSVFGNRERLLPQRSSGYYREYTVPTPGSGDRGARRLVTGADGEVYYTDDHYASFRRVGGGGAP